MGVNYRELLKCYIKHVEASEGVTCLEHSNESDWGSMEWDALKELMDELDFWYYKKEQ